MVLVSPYCGDSGKDVFPACILRNSLFRELLTSDPIMKGICKRLKRKLGENADGSRIDAEIALRMRLDGYDINTSINTILAESEWAKLRTTREERLEYASRIARVSFGTVGDVTIAKQKAEEERRKRSISRSEESKGYAFSPRMR